MGKLQQVSLPGFDAVSDPLIEVHFCCCDLNGEYLNAVIGIDFGFFGGQLQLRSYEVDHAYAVEDHALMVGPHWYQIEDYRTGSITCCWDSAMMAMTEALRLIEALRNNNDWCCGGGWQNHQSDWHNGKQIALEGQVAS